MKTRKPPVISARKRPLQARSSSLVANILEAAARVLASDGVRHFTTARVADKAGISIGSLYQYFPNKEAILFRLQVDEWRDTKALLQGILTDKARPPFTRLRGAVEAFFITEWQEAELRVALDGATPLYRDAPEAQETWQDCIRFLLAFVNEVLPEAPTDKTTFAADMMLTVMSAVGEQISEQGRSEVEVRAMAGAVGDMFCAYLEGMQYP